MKKSFSRSRKNKSKSKSRKIKRSRKNRTRRRKGGYNPMPHIAGPFVGEPWTPKISGWPGVDGVGANRNYLSNNLYKHDPQLMMKLGGKRKKNKTRKGGGLIPQDLVNLGRDISYNIGSTYNALSGYPQPVNPLPYKQPALSKDITII